MKKIVLGVCMSALLFSCGEKKKENTDDMGTMEQVQTSEEMPVDAQNQVSSEFKKGEDLIAASDCLGCHKIDEKLVGPSYKEIAAKYTEKDQALLVTKIIEGGKGVWGEVPMTPHADLSKEDAQEMVKYIIALK